MRLTNRLNPQIRRPSYHFTNGRLHARRESDTEISVSFIGLSTAQRIFVSPMGDEGYYPMVCLKGVEHGGNPSINARDASVRYRCKQKKVGREAHDPSLERSIR